MSKRHTTNFLLSVLMIGAPLVAEEMILSWKGHERVSRPRLYITKGDVARLKKTRATYIEKSLKRFNSHAGLEGNGMDRFVVKSLFGANPHVHKSLVVETISTLSMTLSGIQETLRWGK
ncbi:MAG: hypothetical protein QF437_09405, partial [Planctomycetota bacterium]|nr:hypothetical protein [Planctomycetota bacterium]